VFDLDGCVFDTRPRQVHLFRELAAQEGLDPLYQVTVEHFRDWSTRNTLLNAGIPEAWVDRHLSTVRAWWQAKFFTSTYVVYDHAMPGAPALVRAVHAAGTHVVYLTGRDVKMKRGTETALKRFGFPLGDQASLFVKPSFHMDDTTFKDGALEAISALGEVSLYLDNEPANVNMYRRRHPHALVVFVETDHSPRPDTPDAEIPWLRSFSRGPLA
jgi:beta-phosphoglucomutase-like phosphatase (HAD superfamily)